MTVSWRVVSRERQSFAEIKMAGSRDLNSERFIILNVLFFSCFAAVCPTAQVPVLMWTTESLPPLAPLAAGHITSIEELSAYFSAAFGSGPHTVLLFLQDKLSKEDFAIFGGVYGNKGDGAFQNLEAALQTSSSVSLPAVEWLDSSPVLALLQEKLSVSPVLLDADTLAHLSIDRAVSNLLLINLPYCADSENSCQQLLRDNDEIIGKVVSSMKAKNIPYAAIYTGLQPSRVIPEISMSNQHVGRSLLQTADIKPPIIFNSSGAPCIMLWAEKLNVALSASQPWIDLAAETPSFDGSTCNNTDSQLVLTYPTSGITLSFFMSQRFFPVSARNWFTLNSVQLRSNGMTATFIGSRGIYAPAEYSYHCQSVSSSKDDALLVLSSANQSTSAWRLDFVDFQIQGFGLANGTNFSYASDCAGFFTPGIWMALLTSLILLLIFIYGVHMIMQLNTMDRFDDPKGPSISVPQTE
ncbi:V-type proton ATPase subunit S1-like [Takifugu flavidus]|uniref:V-type proton ATPase subunit S1-like n=1 Tax=Takifugu flavidus TaxID=433684 RepID=UPI00254435CE|nr:V-type proton ATPase subunit S1-like [Takifugu flavidus]